MNKTIRYFLLAITFLFQRNSFGQNIDSLKLALNNAKHDSTRCEILNSMIEAEGDDNVWPEYNEQLKALAEKNISKNEINKKVYLKYLASALNNSGFLASLNGEIPKALEYYKKSLKIHEEIGDRSGVALTFNNIGVLYDNQGDASKAIEFYLKSLKILEAVGNKSGIAAALNNIGFIYEKQGDILKALGYHNRSLKIQEEIGDKKGMAVSLNNIGNLYNNNGDIPNTLEYFHMSLKIREQIGDKTGIASSLNNIGTIYYKQGDFTKALEYHSKSLKIEREVGDKSGIGVSLINIGNIYNIQGNIKKALEYYQMSLKNSDEIGDKRGAGWALGNISHVYNIQGDLTLALEYSLKGLKIQEEINDKAGTATSLNNVACILIKKGQMKEAVFYANNGMQIAKALGFPEKIKNSASTLKQIFQKQNKYKEAFEMFQLEIKMRDSINNQETQKAAVKKQMQYTFERKEKEIKVEQEKKDIIVKEEQQKQKIIKYSISAGLVLVLLFALFILRGYRQKQKANTLITQQKLEVESQKHLIEEKHREITDSINYAERIQRSFLATKELLNENLNDYFVFFQPKDVVSGDFYWANKLSNGHFALATADSTGHGVPGAIMSLLNITSLESAIKEGFLEPSDILNATRKTIIERLKKDGSEFGGKDGMDASLICFDFVNNKFTYAAANNPVWIVRNNEIIELAPDKMPVGKHDRDTIPFTQREVDLQNGDIVYALTDGMPDQFGGPKGKKFMYKKLKELLISISQEPMGSQKQKLFEALNNWKGDLEQVDDICLIGVRI